MVIFLPMECMHFIQVNGEDKCLFFCHGTAQILVSESLLFASEERLFPPFPLFPFSSLSKRLTGEFVEIYSPNGLMFQG